MQSLENSRQVECFYRYFNVRCSEKQHHWRFRHRCIAKKYVKPILKIWAWLIFLSHANGSFLVLFLEFNNSAVCRPLCFLPLTTWTKRTSLQDSCSILPFLKKDLQHIILKDGLGPEGFFSSGPPVWNYSN